MKNILFALLLLGVTVSLHAQKQIVFDENAEVRTITQPFSAISIAGGLDLYLSQADEQGVAVSASDEKENGNIKTVVEGNTLKIYYQGGKRWSRNKKLNVYVSVKNLERLDASGASDITISGTLRSAALKLDISGASGFEGAISVDKLDLVLSGASEASIKGSAATAKVESSGASDINGYELITENCVAKASGASDINLTVNASLDAHASGASHIFYKGSPKIEAAKSQGASNVTRKGR